jgi:hypothetical protein
VARTNSDIEVVGIVIHTGTDPAARQLSGMFSGSDVARLLIDRHKTRVERLTDSIVTKFR